jgi:hypothetical protein
VKLFSNPLNSLHDIRDKREKERERMGMMQCLWGSVGSLLKRGCGNSTQSQEASTT